ncbi:MAG: hypothetical protein LBG92_00920 [Prevotellaceae bacterium]|nr:hypothetical protein [Prevotellaceae bacterium]
MFHFWVYHFEHPAFQGVDGVWRYGSSGDALRCCLRALSHCWIISYENIGFQLIVETANLQRRTFIRQCDTVLNFYIFTHLLLKT